MIQIRLLLLGAAFLIQSHPAFASEHSAATLHPLSQPGQISLTPAFTPDGKTAYFALSECANIGNCPQTLHIARFEDGTWTKPERLGLSLKGYNGETARVDWPSVTPDGKTLLFSWSRERAEKLSESPMEDFDLWSLDLSDKNAKPIALQGEALNLTRGGRLGRIEYFYNETAPELTDTGELYFWTQREGGAGGRDIYLSRKLPDGRFTKPEILPAPINTAGNDTLSWMSADGATMLLTRNGDIHRSKKVDGVWSEPMPLGPHINSSYSDFAATLTPDGKSIVFSSTRPGKDGVAGLIQIWQAAYKD
ncbi:TolB-like translocation protein [Hellea balneolensis]|uniref:PD40 domain-containing protein n=1 Tax=Hellea balneolensis TaxID=287478 RepID=UPI00040E3CAF|nr:PD40 domain-containing protein [Hellea balneolensis]